MPEQGLTQVNSGVFAFPAKENWSFGAPFSVAELATKCAPGVLARGCAVSKLSALFPEESLVFMSPPFDTITFAASSPTVLKNKDHTGFPSPMRSRLTNGPFQLKEFSFSFVRSFRVRKGSGWCDYNCAYFLFMKT